MIAPGAFVSLLRRRLVSFVSGVPCSYLGPLLVELDGVQGIDVVHAANEGEAVAACAGAALGRRRSLAFMQNSGLGNAVSPLASLTSTFRIPMLLLVTWRGGRPGGDEPQHRLMGDITPRLLDLLEIPHEPLPDELVAVEDALDRADHHMTVEGRPYALIVGPDTFRPSMRGDRDPAAPRRSRSTPIERLGVGDSAARPTRADALARIIRSTPPKRSVVLSSTGYTSRELYAWTDRPSHFYMVGSMGCTAALGLGLAVARPDVHVVVVEGDGSALMRLSGLPMVGAIAPRNLVHIVLDNQVHESTGAQPTLSPSVGFADIAHASGYGLAVEGDRLEVLDAVLGARQADGARFAHLRIRPGTSGSLPRPLVTPEQVRERFERHLDGLRAWERGFAPEPRA